MEQIVQINLSDIYVDESFNCRGEIRATDLIDLTQSIERDGLLQPIIITPLSADEKRETGCKYKLIAGFCRHKAFVILKRDSIPSIIREGLDEQTARILNLTENLARCQLNILQEARALEPLRKLGMTEMDIVKKIPNASRGWVQVRVMLLKLPDPVQKEASVGTITQTDIRNLITLKNNGGTDSDITEQVRKIKDAKARCDTLPTSINKKQLACKAKRHRKRPEIFSMQEHIREAIGAGFGTRCLAWAAGEISDLELFESIKEEAVLLDKPYTVSEIALP